PPRISNRTGATAATYRAPRRGCVRADRPLQAAARVAGPAAVPGLEVQVRAGRAPGAAHVADDVALVHGLPIANGDPALVPVQGREAVTVADHHAVPVAALDPGEDHGARLRRVDRRARRRGDVDARVQAAPPVAVLGGHPPPGGPDAPAAAF